MGLKERYESALRYPEYYRLFDCMFGTKCENVYTYNWFGSDLGMVLCTWMEMSIKMLLGFGPQRIWLVMIGLCMFQDFLPATEIGHNCFLACANLLARGSSTKEGVKLNGKWTICDDGKTKLRVERLDPSVLPKSRGRVNKLVTRVIDILHLRRCLDLQMGLKALH